MLAHNNSDDFEYRTPDRSFNGLTLRFAKGRVRAFRMRNIATILGSGILALLVAPLLGLFTLAFALLGECLDLIILRQVPRWIEQGVSRSSLNWRVSVSGAFQALTISICVIATHVYSGSHASLFFALAFLSGAIMNAGLYLPYHKPSSVARIVIYICTFTVAVIYSQFEYQDFEETIFTVLAAFVLVGMCYAMVDYVMRNQRRFHQIEMKLVNRSAALEAKHVELVNAQKETHRLALVAQNANDSVIMSNPDGRITWVNQAFSRITGFSADDVLGKRPAEFLNGPDTDDSGIRKIIAAREQGKEIRIEIFNYTKDGRKIWVDTNIVPIKNAKGDVEMLINIERDVTQAKAHTLELEIARDAAEAGAKAKTEFLATMSHEIRTPMNAILGMSSLLTEGTLPSEQAEQVAIISENAEELMGIIDDILDFSKLESNGLVLAPRRFDLRKMFRSIDSEYTPKALEKNLEFCVEIGDGVPSSVVLDATRLKQVLSNTIENAIKFTRSGRVGINASVVANGNTRDLKCVVTDTGIGIAPDKLTHIFEQFSQAEGSKTRQFGGAGLGLAISQKLARMMGGDISVTSTLNQGSEFTISIPIEHEAGLDAQDTLKADSPIPLGTKVLIVEDTAMNRTILSKYTKGLGCDVRFSKNGAEAVDETERFEPDLIFMDLSMPVMDGVQATKLIRTKHGDKSALPIVALTANALDSDRNKCFAAGMNAFLTKPIRKSDFLAAIAHWARQN